MDMRLEQVYRYKIQYVHTVPALFILPLPFAVWCLHPPEDVLGVRKCSRHADDGREEETRSGGV